MVERKLYYTHNINPHYTHNINPRVAVAVARHLKSPVDYIRYEPMGVDRDAFLSINPNSLAPLLLDGGKPLWEADAISLRLSRLAGGDFWPDAHAEEMMMWVSWSAHHFTFAGAALVWHNFTALPWMGPPDPAVVAEVSNDFNRFAAILDDTLADRAWLVGDRLSYADLAAAAGVSVLDYLGEINWLEAPIAKEWYQRLKSRPSFRPFLSERIPRLAPSSHYADLDF